MRVSQFEMRRHGFVPIERTFENQKLSTARELRKLFRKTGVGSVNERRAALVRQLDCQTLWPMRSSEKARAESRENLNRFVCFVASYLFEFERKLQLEELVVVRLINRLQQLLDTCAGKNL